MKRVAWERDAAFMAIAAVAWPDDFAQATSVRERGSYGTDYNQRAAARSRMKLRWEGYRHAECVDAKLKQMQRAVTAMAAKVDRIIAAANTEDRS